jgi:phosphoribosylanthranilate isomerase
MTCVKICGITNLEDALVTADAGADLLGFVFVSSSPRCIEPERAREIVAALKARGALLRFVGVFVNEPLERVCAVIELVQLDLAQLHGNEAAPMVRALSPRAYKALRPRDEVEAQAQVAEYRAVANGNVPAFIVDAFDAQRYGGTGQRADWSLAARIAREFPILLAGGLGAENVADAIRAVRPWGVDVSSGVERAPGLKDHEQVRRFVQAAKRISTHPGEGFKETRDKCNCNLRKGKQLRFMR